MRARLLVLAVLASSCGGKTALTTETDAGRPDAALPPTAPEPNECGGAAVLEAPVDTPCGTCGYWVCDGLDALRCDGDETNACGECGPVPDERCNGADDDCDGATDEGCVLAIGGGARLADEIRLDGGHAALVAGHPEHDRRSIALVELATDELRFIDPRPDARDSGVAFDGSLIAWQRAPDETEVPEVWVHDLERGATQRISMVRSWGPPDTDGRRVVFASHHEPAREPLSWGYTIWDATTGERTVLYSSSAGHAAIEGDWLVHDTCLGSRCGRPGQGEVWAIHLGTGERLHLSDGLDGVNRAPSLDGGRVVWRTEREGGEVGAAHLYDLSTRTRRVLTSDAEVVASGPRLRGDRVCYSLRPDGGDLRYLVDLTVLDVTTGAKLLPSRRAAVGCDLSDDAAGWIAFSAGRARIRYLDPSEP